MGIYPEKTIVEKDTCTPVFIVALFAIARTWKQPRCPSTDDWIKKLWYIYTTEYYSVINRNTFESVLMRWMNLESIIHSEVSQKEKDEYYILTQAMAPHSSTFAWKIPWTEEPGGLQSMGLLGSDTTKRLHFHFSLSSIGQGNGNPFQCSCLENPRDRGAWWATVYGVAQSRTRMK